MVYLWPRYGDALQSAPLIISTMTDFYPDVSPSGEQIAFISTRSGAPEIWVSDRQGSQHTRLTTLENDFTRMPRWSPDGRRLAFQAFHDGQYDVYVIDAQGGAPLRVTDAPTDELLPTWSRDGQFLYFASNRTDGWHVWKQPVAGGEAVQVTDAGGYASFESYDGTALFFTRLAEPGLWERTLATGVERQLTSDLHPADWNSWAVTEKGIFFPRREGMPDTALLRLDLVTRQVTLLTRFMRNIPAGYYGWGLTVMPDESEVLYVRQDKRESDIMLVENASALYGNP